MPTTDDILLKNLDDALQRAHRYVWLGVVSAALFAILSTRAPQLIAKNQEVDVPVVGKVSPGMAAVVLFLAYLAFPLLAALAIARIRRIASRIADQQVVRAALTRFSIVTLDNGFLRVIPGLTAPFLILVAYVLEQARGAARLDVFTVVIGFAVIWSPYLLLVAGLWKPFADMPKERS